MKASACIVSLPSSVATEAAGAWGGPHEFARQCIGTPVQLAI